MNLQPPVYTTPGVRPRPAWIARPPAVADASLA
jgi:hypothetical protein